MKLYELNDKRVVTKAVPGVIYQMAMKVVEKTTGKEYVVSLLDAFCMDKTKYVAISDGVSYHLNIA